MAILHSKQDLINKVLAENIHENLRVDLRARVMKLVEPEITAMVNEVVDDLVTKIESFNNIDGSINVRVEFSKREQR